MRNLKAPAAKTTAALIREVRQTVPVRTTTGRHRLQAGAATAILRHRAAVAIVHREATLLRREAAHRVEVTPVAHHPEAAIPVVVHPPDVVTNRLAKQDALIANQ